MKRCLVLFLFAVLTLTAALCTAAQCADDADNLPAEEEQSVKGEAIVTIKLNNGGSEPTSEEIRAAAERAAAGADAYVAEVYDAISKASGMACVLLRSDTLTTEQMIEQLRLQPDVMSAEPNLMMKLEAVDPNDPGYINGSAWGMKAIGADKAWARTTGSTDIYVTVIDSGINLNHEDLKDNIAEAQYRKNYVGVSSSAEADDNVNDTNGHGSHVAGIIGAVGNNGKGVVGVNWRVKLMPYRVSGSDGRGSTHMALEDLLKLLKAANPPRIAAINISMGGWVNVSPDNYLTRYADGIAIKGLSELPNVPLIAVSAGNDGLEHTIKDTERTENGGSNKIPANSYHYPSSLSRLDSMTSLISVAATAKNGGAYDYTNWSDEFVDVAAPGDNIYSTVNGGESAYGSKWGTSMAAPHVSGAAALLAARLEAEGRPWDGKMLKKLLIETADGNINPTSTYSGNMKISKHGQINLAAAMASLDIRITGINVLVSPALSDDTLTIGSEATLTANIEPNNATDKKVTWSADNNNITFVSSDDTKAVIRGTAAGEVTITASAADGAAVTGTLTLTIAASGHTHDWNTEKWEFDGNQHWRKCKECDERTDIEDHSGGTWGTTSEPGYHSKTCEVCDETYARDEHKNSSDMWEHDQSGHWKLCKDCGAKTDVGGHTQQKTFEKDADNHWYPCSVCGEKLSETKHNWNRKLEHNSLKHWRKCTDCLYQETPGSDHVWSDNWQKNDTEHRKICTVQGCMAEGQRGNHADADSDGYCDECKIPMPNHVHSGGEWQSGPEQHWKICGLCKERYDIANHTEERRADDEHHWMHCKVCGYDGEKNAHIRDKSWKHSAMSHWQECTVCTRAKAGSSAYHTFGNDGLCTVCKRFDVTKVVVIPSPSTQPSPSAQPFPSAPAGSIISGNNFLWTDGGKVNSIVIAMPPESFIKVMINNTELIEGAEYTVNRPTRRGGSTASSRIIAGESAVTEITFTEQLLKRLSTGIYTATAKFVGREVPLKFTVSRDPNAALSPDTPSGMTNGHNSSGSGCEAGGALFGSAMLFVIFFSGAFLGRKTIKQDRKI